MSLQGQLHHTKCIYNALANIKPEVESTIKLGRKLVETSSVPDCDATSKNIDNLKELFNVLGSQVTEAKHNLEKAALISDTLMDHLTRIFDWLGVTMRRLSGELRHNNQSQSKETEVSEVISEMQSMKLEVRELLRVKSEFVSLCEDPNLLTGLKVIIDQPDHYFTLFNHRTL